MRLPGAYSDEHLEICTLSEVDYYYRNGFVSYAQWQRYRCKWRNGAPRFSEECSEHDGHNASTCPLVAACLK